MRVPAPSRKAVIGTSVAAALVVAGAVAGLKPSEGYREFPYKDIAGVWTDCFGETQGVVPGVARGKAKCEALLVKRVHDDYYMPLATTIPGFTYLPAPTQMATVELAYNVGPGRVASGSVGQLLGRGHIKEGCEAFMLYNKARVNGTLREVKGLTDRRARERAKCLEGVK
jgi:lysozyme